MREALFGIIELLRAKERKRDSFAIISIFVEGHTREREHNIDKSVIFFVVRLDTLRNDERKRRRSSSSRITTTTEGKTARDAERQNAENIAALSILFVRVNTRSLPERKERKGEENDEEWLLVFHIKTSVRRSASPLEFFSSLIFFLARWEPQLNVSNFFIREVDEFAENVINPICFSTRLIQFDAQRITTEKMINKPVDTIVITSDVFDRVPNDRWISLLDRKRWSNEIGQIDLDALPCSSLLSSMVSVVFYRGIYSFTATKCVGRFFFSNDSILRRLFSISSVVNLRTTVQIFIVNIFWVSAHWPRCSPP